MYDVSYPADPNIMGGSLDRVLVFHAMMKRTYIEAFLHSQKGQMSISFTAMHACLV